MTASFNPSLPTSLDKMRDVLGDTSLTAPFAPDETYTAYLAENTNWKLAAAAMARSFASRAINRPTSFTAVGDVAVSWADRAQSWLRIAASLEAQVARETAPSDTGTLNYAYPSRLDDEDGEYSNGLRGW
jgi:hypothetical protein